MAEFVSNLDPEQRVLSHDEALMQGRAADGGVLCFKPKSETYPSIAIEELRELIDKDYIDIATLVSSRLVGDEVPETELRAVAEAAYDSKNFPLAPEGKVVTITPLYSDIAIGNISNGVTGSFKDNGMSHLAYNTQRVVTARGEKLAIAGTTTGDTGPAAQYYFHGLENISVTMFSPEAAGAENPSSPFQRAQAEAYAGGNIQNVRMPASFDVLSSMLENVKKQPGFEKLGAINSVNIARVIPQVVTYFGLCLEAINGGHIREGQNIDVVIPSGNFGNALSAYIAREMGAPIDDIVLANTKENDALHNLVQHGIYEKRDSKITIASAMDIMAPANLPRLIFDMLGGDVQRMTKFMTDYKNVGAAALQDVGLPPTYMREWGFDSGTASREEILGTMVRTHIDTAGKVGIDPHTAVALRVAKNRRDKTNNFTVVVETAQDAKFEDTQRKALGFTRPRPAHLKSIETSARDNRHNTKIIAPTEGAMKAVLRPFVSL